MNEHDSKEAHEARDASVKRLAQIRINIGGRGDLCHIEALEGLLMSAWEDGFDFARRNDHD